MNESRREGVEVAGAGLSFFVALRFVVCVSSIWLLLIRHYRDILILILLFLLLIWTLNLN